MAPYDVASNIPLALQSGPRRYQVRHAAAVPSQEEPAAGHGLTLVHLPAQPEPFLT